MSGKNPRPDRHQSPASAAGAPALAEAARAWTALVDGWWRQQSATLPPDLKSAMTATLDQSKALVDLACSQAARAFVTAEATPRAADPGSLPAAGDAGLWRPVIDAFRACQTDLVGSAGESDKGRSGAMLEYRRAAGAYLSEFAQINIDVAERLQKRIAAAPPADFRQLHALVVEEAERAYLDRVSGDAFAARQADFINASLKLRQARVKTGRDADR